MNHGRRLGVVSDRERQREKGKKKFVPPPIRPPSFRGSFVFEFSPRRFRFPRIGSGSGLGAAKTVFLNRQLGRKSKLNSGKKYFCPHVTGVLSFHDPDFPVHPIRQSKYRVSLRIKGRSSAVLFRSLSVYPSPMRDRVKGRSEKPASFLTKANRWKSRVHLPIKLAGGYSSQRVGTSTEKGSVLGDSILLLTKRDFKNGSI